MAPGKACGLGAKVHHQHGWCSNQLRCDDDVLHDQVYSGMAGICLSADSAPGVPPIHKHYEAIADQLRISTCEETIKIEGNVIIVPVAGITHVVMNSLEYAKSLSPQQIIAVYVPFEREDEAVFEEKWRKWQPDVRLVTLYTPYRSIVQPLTKFIDKVNWKAAELNHRVTVIIPQFIPKKGWHNILHNQSSLLIRARLLFRSDVIVTTVPYHLKK